MATFEVANDDVDFLGVAGKFMQILDIGDRGGLECRCLERPRVVRIYMASMDTEGTGGGHVCEDQHLCRVSIPRHETAGTYPIGRRLGPGSHREERTFQNGPDRAVRVIRAPLEDGLVVRPAGQESSTNDPLFRGSFVCLSGGSRRLSRARAGP